MISVHAPLILAAVALTACSNEETKSPPVFKEAIRIKGTCSEDHVSRPDSYAGLIVRWQIAGTEEVSTYGSLMRLQQQQQILAEAFQPNAYHPPFMISFRQIDVDTSQTTWVLHGLSDRGEDGSQGYYSTCNVEVVERSNKLWDWDDHMKWLEMSRRAL
jgi:hypothetical protein